MRRSGILLHPTSLLGRAGIGSIGKPARDFLQFLSDAGQQVWQMLPLVPTDDGGCPYNSTSALAANTRLIDLDDLCDDPYRLLSLEDLKYAPIPDHPERAEFKMAGDYKNELIQTAFARLVDSTDPIHRKLWQQFESFCEENADWLDDFALFDTLQAKQPEGPVWTTWPKGLRDRDPDALEAARDRFDDEIEWRKFAQFLFHRQWTALKARATELGIKIMGDVPIFVSHNSVDVWAHRDLFELDEKGFPGFVSGVPPDYFSPEGQLWGNPLYAWPRHAKTGYAWWISRLRAMNKLADIVRLDHFRGFEAFWRVASTEKTAINGEWVKGPGIEFFRAVKKALPNLEIIAEDLGIVTPAVEKLRKDADFPGMRVLEFGFPIDEPNDHHALHMHTPDSVVYCGTHDNDTICGWYDSLDEGMRDHVRRYLSIDGRDIAWQLMRAAESSVADLCILTVQDIFCYGTWARMNVPGVAKGNWTWRMVNTIPGWNADRLRELTALYGRLPVYNSPKA